MLTSKQKKALNEVYNKIDYTFQSIKWGQYGNQYYNMIKDEEKQHRKGKPSHVTCGLSISEAIKLFYVRDIIEALQEKYSYTIKDYLHIRQSVLMAYSLVANYREEIEKALEGVNFDEILSLDYAELMK